MLFLENGPMKKPPSLQNEAWVQILALALLVLGPWPSHLATVGFSLLI